MLQLLIFNITIMSYNLYSQNKILMKISEFTVTTKYRGPPRGFGEQGKKGHLFQENRGTKAKF